MRELAAAVVLGACLLAGCADDGGSTAIVDAFSDCIRDGGGRITGDVELVVSSGRALATVGPGVEADDALLSRCLERSAPR